MKLTRRENIALLGGAAIATIIPGAAMANGTVHEVQMLNRHPETGDAMVFYPDIVRAEPGDTIRFVPTDRGHNAQANEDAIPEGAEAWESRINEEFEVTLNAEGAHLYYCTPHRTTGMVGLILVGDVSGNFEAVKKARFRGRERQRYAEIFARADEILESESS